METKRNSRQMPRAVSRKSILPIHLSGPSSFSYVSHTNKRVVRARATRGDWERSPHHSMTNKRLGGENTTVLPGGIRDDRWFHLLIMVHIVPQEESPVKGRSRPMHLFCVTHTRFAIEQNPLWQKCNTLISPLDK